MTDKPTEAQIKEFWEWMGFKYIERTDLPGTMGWRDPEGYHALECFRIPDLNNLFKYAVPKINWMSLSKGIMGCWTAEVRIYPSFGLGYESGLCDDEQATTPALALFWALWQVKEKQNEDKSCQNR